MLDCNIIYILSCDDLASKSDRRVAGWRQCQRGTAMKKKEKQITRQLEEIRGSFAPTPLWRNSHQLHGQLKTSRQSPRPRLNSPTRAMAIEDPASRRLLPHQRWSPHLASKQPPPLQTSPPSPLLDLTICISKVRPAFANYELISETPIASAAVP